MMGDHNWWWWYDDQFNIRSSVTQLGGPIKFSLYGSDSASGVYTGFDVSGTRNSGYRVTDTAGAIVPNSLAPDFRSLDSGGGINITADGARLLDLNTINGCSSASPATTITAVPTTGPRRSRPA
jgi:hypothetical protein